MKMAVLAACILIFLSVSLADNYSTKYSAEYTAGDWLNVTRTVQQTDNPCFGAAVSNVCMNDGAVYPPGEQNGLSTMVTLSVQNIGQIERDNISIGEDLSFVPDGAKLEFFPAPSTNDGRQVFWAIGNLQPNESRSVSYGFSAMLRGGAEQGMPQLSVVSQPVFVYLSAPAASTVGDSLAIMLRTSSGKPVSGAVVYVVSPDGSRHPLLTGRDGVATFTASTLGRYTYSVDGYQLQAPVSTNAGLPASPVAAAAVGDSGLLFSSLAGMLPVLAAIFAIAVLVLIIYNFFASRREDDDDSYMQPQPGTPAAQSAMPASSAQPVYTQSFSFSPVSQHDNSMRQTTRGILESRRQLKQSGQQAAQGSRVPEASERQRVEEPQESEPDDDGQASGEWQQAGEQTEAQDDAPSQHGLDSQIARLEAKAREEGETASEEEEIERTIAELEAIREKLRSRKIAGPAETRQTIPAISEEEGPSIQEQAEEPEIDSGERSDGFAEQEDSRSQYPKKPSAKPSKPRKMKYASHGTRRK